MEEFNIIPTEKFFFKQCPHHCDTGIPLKHDYIFIKEVDTPNGISYHGGGGGDVIHDFWYLGKGDEGDKKLKCYTFVWWLICAISSFRYGAAT